MITMPNGSRCGTRGRAMGFCLDRLGSNPGWDFGFFQFRIPVNLVSLGAGLFRIAQNRTVHLFILLSSFLKLFSIGKFIICNLTRERKNISRKRGQERTFLKSFIRMNFLKDGPTTATIFNYFSLFVQKILLISRIRTRIIRVEGEDVDH